MSAVLLLLAFLAGVLVCLLFVSLVVRLRPERRDEGPFIALIRRAVAEIAAEDHPAAAAALREAVAEGPDEPALYLLLTDELDRAGDAARAERTVEVLLARRDLSRFDRAAALLLRARIDERRGQLEEALASCRLAIAEAPDWSAPLVAAERLETRLGRLADAVATAEKLAGIDRQRGRLVAARRRVLLARELLALGKAREAEREAERALTQARGLAAAEITLGDALFQARDVKRAREAWLRAARGAPHLAPLVVDRLEELGDRASGRDAARQFAAEALSRAPSGPGAWRLACWLADDALRRGQLLDARGSLDTAERLAPQSAAAARLRARLAMLEDGVAGRSLAQLRSAWEEEGPACDPWRCQQCGHRVQEFEWRCPSCRAWESLA